MFEGIKNWFKQLSDPVQKEKAVLQKFSVKYQECDKIRLHLIFYGKVQGVGFRYSATMLANELGLTGWVKNLSDGTVEMQVQGSTQLIDKLVEGLSDNQFIEIDRIDDQRIGIDDSEGKFEMAN
ncbi:acylphosphatase [Ligilactobacillus sp.]|uniref:acylphosphatase n=1 Tax=Ligilactobacillus sp. TaxID=2767921 RepID=UPI003FA5C826